MTSVEFDSAVLFVFIFSLVVITSALKCSLSGDITNTCADLVEIKYPFWNKNVNSVPEDPIPHQCGYPGFGLYCESWGTITVINISNHLYRTVNINYESKFVRMTEMGMDGEECPHPRRNFSFQQFGSSLRSMYGDWQFFYNCSDPHNGYLDIFHLGCLDNSGRRSYAFRDRIPTEYNWYRNCEETLVAPATNIFGSIFNYASEAKQGVFLEWSAPIGDCENCERSGGLCSYNSTDGFHSCACGSYFSKEFYKTCPPPDKGLSPGVSPSVSPSNQPTFNSNHRQKGLSTRVKVLIGIFIGVGALLLLVLLIYRRILFSIYSVVTSYWRNNINGPTNVEIFLKNSAHLNVQRYKYSDIKKMTNSFKETLGQGGYGYVFKGKLKCDGRLVAVKMLNESKGNGEDFINEVATIGTTNHVNVVSLLGFCTEGTKRALVYEFMSNGSLERFIYNEKTSSTPLGWEKLYQIALGIARGLEYLHRGCNMRILHFDIKPHNILLDQEFCPKISDFGLAKLCPTRESVVSMLAARGTIGYIAPEVYCRNFGGVSHKSDVYSYGMMVFEIIGGRKNIDPTVKNISEIYFPKWIYNHLNQDINVEGYGEIFKDETTKKMIIVALWCVQTQPADRPSMSKVVEMLEGSTKELQMPPNPFQDPPSMSSP